MARIEEIVPFILYFEAGLSRQHLTLPKEAMFAQAKKTGWANDPDDMGGATMCGITFDTYKRYCQQEGKACSLSGLKNISYSEWLEVLKNFYWDRWQADRINNQSIANILIDWVWASGVHGIKIPQRMLGVTVDGIVGEKTLTALNGVDSEQFFRQLHKARVNFVEDIVRRRPRQKKFLRGWLRRINCIEYSGLKYE